MTKRQKIRAEVLDELLEVIENPEDILNEKNVFLDLKKALIEKALEGELGYHLGYPKHGEHYASPFDNLIKRTNDPLTWQGEVHFNIQSLTIIIINHIQQTITPTIS